MKKTNTSHRCGRDLNWKPVKGTHVHFFDNDNKSTRNPLRNRVRGARRNFACPRQGQCARWRWYPSYLNVNVHLQERYSCSRTFSSSGVGYLFYEYHAGDSVVCKRINKGQSAWLPHEQPTKRASFSHPTWRLIDDVAPYPHVISIPANALANYKTAAITVKTKCFVWETDKGSPAGAHPEIYYQGKWLPLNEKATKQMAYRPAGNYAFSVRFAIKKAPLTIWVVQPKSGTQCAAVERGRFELAYTNTAVPDGFGTHKITTKPITPPTPTTQRIQQVAPKVPFPRARPKSIAHRTVRSKPTSLQLSNSQTWQHQMVPGLHRSQKIVAFRHRCNTRYTCLRMFQRSQRGRMRRYCLTRGSLYTWAVTAQDEYCYKCTNRRNDIPRQRCRRLPAFGLPLASRNDILLTMKKR